MHGHLTTKSLRFVVQKQMPGRWFPIGPDGLEIRGRPNWLRERGFPRLVQAEKHKDALEKLHPGNTYRIRDLREGGNG